MLFSAYLLVHGVSGASDSARRYPERHSHTDAPLMVAWLNPGQPVHCPSVPDLNWPTGQAEEDRRGKQMKQIIMSSNSGHDLRMLKNITQNTHTRTDSGQTEFANTFLFCFVFFVRVLECQMVADWQTEPCNEGYKLKTITVMNLMVIVNLMSKPACHWHAAAYHWMYLTTSE